MFILAKVYVGTMYIICRFPFECTGMPTSGQFWVKILKVQILTLDIEKTGCQGD